MKTKIGILFSVLVLTFSACSDDKVKSNKFTLQASNNMYVVINSDSLLVATEPTAAKAEIFEKEKQPNGKWALKTSKGKYICDERNNDALHANRSSVGDWEQFEIIRIEPTKINIKSSQGKFVCTDQGTPSNKLIANRDAAGEWESFIIEKK